MIDMEINGTLPMVASDFSPVMEKIAERMARSVQLNFDLGGRPGWVPLKGVQETPLVLTGRLRRSIYKESDATTSEVGSRGVPYAGIHQFGGTIKHPGSSKRQAFRVGEEWVVTNYTRPHDIRIPARPYLVFQDSDIEEYKSMLVGHAITIEHASFKQ